MRRKRIHKTAIDTGKSGLYITTALQWIQICDDLETAKQLIRAGRITIDYTRIKDIQYLIQPGTVRISKDNQTIAEVTIL